MFYFKQLKAILWLQGGVKRENGELTIDERTIDVAVRFKIPLSNLSE